MFSQSGSEPLLPISFTVNSMPGSIHRAPSSIPKPPISSRFTLKPTWMSSSPSPSTSISCSRDSVLTSSSEKREAVKEITSYLSVI